MRLLTRLPEKDVELPPLRNEDGQIPICAWCGCVRTADGTWAPLGPLLPSDRRLLLTHGICPACREDPPER